MDFFQLTSCFEISAPILYLLSIQEKANISYWQKNVHQVLVNHLGLSLPRKKSE